jgi:VIT1/CCC1 family predicted Fe2+/Mn2+ transporter
MKESIRAFIHREEMAAARDLVKDYEWLHTCIGIFGGVAFFVGSIMFLSPAWITLGTWLFIVGSLGMLVDSSCKAFISMEKW